MHLFGLNVLSVRLPMVIISCISLIIFYLLLKEIANKKLAIIGLFVFAICPWHIMKSRWGLESNLFPDFILFFIYFLIIGLKRKNKFYYYLSFCLAGISAYSYATSYFFLPLFIVPLLILLIYKKEIHISQAILSLCLITIITLPLILFVIINTFNLPEINLVFTTIPRLTVNRFEVLTATSSNNFFYTCLYNFLAGIKILITQNDKLPWNALKEFGTTYIFSIVFFIIGFMGSFFKGKNIDIKNNNEFNKNISNNNLIKIKNKTLHVNTNKLTIEYSYIFKIWFIICILLMFICEPNINRLNIIFIPIIYYISLGIYFLINASYNKKTVSLLIIFIYLISFLVFTIQYFNQNWDNYFTFEGDLEEVVNYINKLDMDRIYITNKIKEPYIYMLFYSEDNPKEFYSTVEYYNQNVEFRQVKHYKNYYFENINNINFEKNNRCAYLILKKDLSNYIIDLSQFKITEFKKYIIIENI